MPEWSSPHLRLAAQLEHADGLAPDRVVYLIEAAYDADQRGEHTQAEHLCNTVIRAATRIGLVLPLPEARHLDRLSRAAHGPITSP